MYSNEDLELFRQVMSKANLLLNCRAKKINEIVNKQVKFLTTQYIGTCKSVYTKGYALN